MENKEYNPDVLNCIANLSNDEVFTPPALANQVLDMLPQELFCSPTTTFLDPFCKSGVFLREIVKRLDLGLAEAIPNRQKRIDHIMHHQVYGIALTELTSLLSRRTLYCSKSANSQHSVSYFDDEQGHVFYKAIKHTWVNGKCKYCGASKEVYDRGSESEQYAYQFIHTDNPEKLFPKNMKFDVIIGNPPYQLSDGGAAISATPIYNLFVDQAKKLNPHYLCMIIPARWYAGGKGLDDFRTRMLNDNRIRIIHDYPDASDIFPGVQIKNGVCYFLWDRDSNGLCKVYSHCKDKEVSCEERPLLEKDCVSFIRFNEAIDILHKVQAHKEVSIVDMISSRKPFGLDTKFHGTKEKVSNDDVLVYENGGVGYVDIAKIQKNVEWIDYIKVLIPRASSGSDSFPHPILGCPFVVDTHTVCSETYMVAGCFKSINTANNYVSYIKTRLFRFLVLLMKSTQDTPKVVYTYVPLQDFSHPWTDEMLYEKYGLDENEIAFIESMIRPME